VIDSKEPSITVEEYAYGENRYRALKAKDPDLAAELMKQLEADVKRRWNYLKHLASWVPGA
jgi:pyruvate-ferredoxin/flavodoxin oxidoreductase